MPSVPPFTMRHDPFARGCYHRTSYYQKQAPIRETCAWCGDAPDRLFSYVWNSDGRTIPREPDGHARKFCNFQCHFSYFD